MFSIIIDKKLTQGDHDGVILQASGRHTPARYTVTFQGSSAILSFDMEANGAAPKPTKRVKSTTEETPLELATGLRRIRAQMQWTIDEFADKTGVNPSTLGRILRVMTKAQGAEVRVAAAAIVTLNEFLQEWEKTNEPTREGEDD